MLKTNIISPRQQDILDDAFQKGAPWRVSTEKNLVKRGLEQVLNERGWNRKKAQVWAFQFYMEDRNRFGTVGRIFEHARNVFYRLRHLVMGIGYESAEDIFRQVARGEVARQHDRSIAQTKNRQIKKHDVFIVGWQDDRLLKTYRIESHSASEAERDGMRRFLRDWRKENGSRPPAFYVSRQPPESAVTMEPEMNLATDSI